MYMFHPRYPKMKIPAVRLLGIGLHPALPVSLLSPGDPVVMDYGKVYRISHFSPVQTGKMRIYLFNSRGDSTSRIVQPNTHMAVSWGMFSRRWKAPAQAGGKSMTKTGKKIKLAKKLDLRTPINSGVSFQGKIGLTKQGGKRKKGY